MANTDSRGQTLSTASDVAAGAYRRGVDLLLSAWPGADEAFGDAIAADPDFALAHAARARLQAIRADLAIARQTIGKAEERASHHATERERSHVAVLSRVINGRAPQALELALAHLERWPRDALILSLPLGAFGLFAFSGISGHDQARVDLCERHAAHYAADDWWFLTYRGWSHGENGDVLRGRSLSERAYGLRRENANAVHALSHAMYEGGDGEAAESLIGDWLPDYDRKGILHGHIAWHSALAALERGDAARALALYGAHVQPSVSAGLPINIVTDTASFLWRLRAYGHAVPPELWNAAATYAAPKFPKAGLAFIDVHMAILAAATGDRAAVEGRVAALERLVEESALPAGPVAPALCRAILAFAEGDYPTCARLLEPMAQDVVRIGGSGAQRDVFEDTLLLALIRSGEITKARDLLDERLHRRPSSRDALWRGGLHA